MIFILLSLSLAIAAFSNSSLLENNSISLSNLLIVSESVEVK